MCNAFDVEITSKMRRLSEFLKNSENYLDFKNAKIFSKYENEDYIIDLIFEMKLLYKLFYILFEIELDVLKIY